MAEGIAAAGGTVAVWGKDQNAEALETSTPWRQHRAYVCDVATSLIVQSMNQTTDDFGRLDGLFANAGRGGTGKSFVDMSLADWRSVMAVNLDGVSTLRQPGTDRAR